MTEEPPKFKNTWTKRNEDDMTVGEPFHVLEEAHGSEWLRFTYDEITNTLTLHNVKGKALLYIENSDIKEFFKKVSEFKKALKEHPLGVLE